MNLRIGGFVPCSLSDFPGKIASVVFTAGCNWRCPWCHNPGLVYPEQFGAVLDCERTLRRIAGQKGLVDGVVISGGEPTIHSGLPNFIRRICNQGFLVKLDTNGSNPGVLRTLLGDRLLHFVAVDLKAPWPRYQDAAGVTVDIEKLKETLDLLRSSLIPHHLRTTLWPGLTETDLREIALVASGSPHLVQAWRPPPRPTPHHPGTSHPPGTGQFPTIARDMLILCPPPPISHPPGTGR